MAKMTKKEIEDAINALQSRYSFRFGGHPRVTRSITELDEIIAEAKTLLKKTHSLQRHVSGELRTAIQERIDLYESERAKIVEAQSGGEAAKQTALLGAEANSIMHLYRRHFSAQDRGTRDLGLLQEMIDLLSDVQSRMKALAETDSSEALTQDMDVVQQNLDLYTNELTAISDTQKDADQETRANRLATLANNQFAVYRTHFANRKRLSRRPGLLERVVGQLEAIDKSMSELTLDSIAEVNAKNKSIVVERLTAYRDEVKAIADAHNRSSLMDRIYALGEAANEAMGEYRKDFAGQNRATRDLDLLRGICDRLLEIKLQMSSIDKEQNLEVNARNLSIVRDTLRSYEREFDEIRNAKEQQNADTMN